MKVVVKWRTWQKLDRSLSITGAKSARQDHQALTQPENQPSMLPVRPAHGTKDQTRPAASEENVQL